MGTLLLHLYNNFFVDITFYKLENSSKRFHCSYYTIKTISETTAKTAMLHYISSQFEVHIRKYTDGIFSKILVHFATVQFKRNLLVLVLIHLIDD